MGAARPVRAGPRDLLFRDPAAHEEAAEEGAGVPGGAEGGRRVVTTGGIFGSITKSRTSPSSFRSRRTCGSMSRARPSSAIQGQDPVVADQARSIMSTRTCAGSCSPSSASSACRCSRSIRPAQKVRLGLDLKGGVHLVLRVQTDDALRLLTETHGRPAAGVAAHGRSQRRDRSPRRASPTFTRRGRAAGSGRSVPQRRSTDRRSSSYDRSSSGPGSYTFTMKPNIAATSSREHGQPGAPDDRAARQRARRRRADRRAARRRGSDPGAAARRRPTSNRAKEIIRSTALLELKLVEQGPFPTRRPRGRPTTATCRPTCRDPARPQRGGGAGQAATAVYYAVQKVPAVTGRDLRNAPPVARRVQPAGGRASR